MALIYFFGTFQISDGEESRAAVQQLFDCMQSTCCPTTSFLPIVLSCTIASGHTGENLTVVNGVPRRRSVIDDTLTLDALSDKPVSEGAVKNNFDFLF